MTEIRGIVLPLDGSEVSARAVPVVRDLAACTGAEVTLVTSTVDGAGATTDELDAAEVALGGAVVHRIGLDDRGPASAAIDVTLAGEHRILCMSTHGRGGLRTSVLGSVASEVVRSGDVPLLLVGPGCDPEGALDRSGPIMLCIDGSERSGAVVAAGAAWSGYLDRSVAMRMAVDPFDAVTSTTLEQMFDRLRPPLDATGCDVDTGRIVTASVAHALVAHAEMEKSPLMVLAPAAISGWMRLLVGDVTLSVVGHAPCPVLVLPEGAVR